MVFCSWVGDELFISKSTSRVTFSNVKQVMQHDSEYAELSLRVAPIDPSPWSFVGYCSRSLSYPFCSFVNSFVLAFKSSLADYSAQPQPLC